LAPHVAGAVHVPHDATVREPPQLSAAVTDPQFLPSLVQNAVSISAVHPQRLAVPPVPQPLGVEHVPQVTVRAVPQLSAAVTDPQFFPSREQNAASLSLVHPHTFARPPPAHVLGDEHVPQSATVRMVPQLSAPVKPPQFLPSLRQNAGLVSAVHAPPPGTQA
jgi:hypothetical protein